MLDNFTDQAIRVVVLAQEEARLLNHNYVGTEHILLGLIHEGEGVAAKALESLGISIEAVRQQGEKIIGQGQRAPSGYIPFTPRVKKVLGLSLRESIGLGDNYVGTEHILLGLIREGDGVAAQVLVRLDADLNAVRQRVIQLLDGDQGEKTAARGEPSQVQAPPSSPQVTKWPFFWLSLLGFSVFLAGAEMYRFQVTKPASAYFIWAGVAFDLLVMWRLVLRAMSPARPTTAVVVILAIALLFAFPSVLVFLVTGGNDSSLVIAALFRTPRHSGWLRSALLMPETLLLGLVPGLLIAAPEILRRWVRWLNSGAFRMPSRLTRRLPGGLAAGAALASGLFAFLLHFGGGPLAKPSLLQLAVAIVFAVTLLVPPYRFIARVCWERGIAEVFDPGCWRKEWREAKAEVIDTFWT
jgi:Clp amino terminal domain, pathogenicity island component